MLGYSPSQRVTRKAESGPDEFGGREEKETEEA